MDDPLFYNIPSYYAFLPLDETVPPAAATATAGVATSADIQEPSSTSNYYMPDSSMLYSSTTATTSPSSFNGVSSYNDDSYCSFLDGDMLNPYDFLLYTTASRQQQQESLSFDEPVEIYTAPSPPPDTTVLRSSSSTRSSVSTTSSNASSDIATIVEHQNSEHFYNGKSYILISSSEQAYEEAQPEDHIDDNENDMEDYKAALSSGDCVSVSQDDVYNDEVHNDDIEVQDDDSDDPDWVLGNDAITAHAPGRRPITTAKATTPTKRRSPKVPTLSASGSHSNRKDESNIVTICSNCKTTNTPLWRRDDQGHPLCNACGLFLKLHGMVRPLSLKTDVIKKRNRQSSSGTKKRKRKARSSHQKHNNSRNK